MLIIGHRANVLRIVQRYIRCGVKGYEIDVRYDEKRGLVALHGPSPVKRPSIPGRIMGWIDYKFFYRDPLIKPMKLEELVAYIESRVDKPVYMFDLRSTKGLQELITIIEKYNLWKRVMVSSEIHPVIREIKDRTEDNLTCLISLGVLPVNIVRLIEDAKADGVSMKFSLLDEEIVNNLHGKGYTVAAWTVNDSQTLSRMMSLGVDVVISDDPCRIMK